MSLGTPQKVLFHQYENCVERTKKKIALGDDVVYFILDTCSVIEDKGNRSYTETAKAVELICHRLCPGQWCDRSHCREYSRHFAYNCKKTYPNICKEYKKYVEKREERKNNNVKP